MELSGFRINGVRRLPSGRRRGGRLVMNLELSVCVCVRSRAHVRLVENTVTLLLLWQPLPHPAHPLGSRLLFKLPSIRAIFIIFFFRHCGLLGLHQFPKQIVPASFLVSVPCLFCLLSTQSYLLPCFISSFSSWRPLNAFLVLLVTAFHPIDHQLLFIISSVHVLFILWRWNQ